MSKLDKFLSIIENPTRRRILAELVREPHYPLQLSKELRVSQQAIMKHLKLLEEHELVKCHLEESDLGGPQRKIYVPTMKFTLIVDVGPNLFDARVLERKGAEKDDLTLDSQDNTRDLEDGDQKDLEIRLNQLRGMVAEIEEELETLQERRTKLVELKERISENTRRLVEGSNFDYLIRRILYEYVLRPELGPREIARELAVRDEVVMDMLKDVIEEGV